MQTLSINEILIKIDQRLETLNLNDHSAPLVSLDPLSEVGLYITFDRLLADLYKQYLEAQRNYIRALQTHGEDAAMTETASYMSESAFCAMETRLIELREEKELSERVIKVQTSQRDTYVKEMQERQKAYARRGIQQPQNVKTIPKADLLQKKEPVQADAFWALLAFSMLAQETLNSHHFTPTAREFAQAAA